MMIINFLDYYYIHNLNVILSTYPNATYAPPTVNRPVIIVNLIPSFGIYIVYNNIYTRIYRAKLMQLAIIIFILKKHIIHMYPFVLNSQSIQQLVKILSVSTVQSL